MAKACGLTLFVLSLVVSTVVCQTFQYSRGWTNGKRAPLYPTEGFLDKNGAMLMNAFGGCQMQKLRQLLQGSPNEEPLQPCEMFNSPKRSFSENLVPPHF